MLRKLFVGVALLGLFPLVGCALVPPVTKGVEQATAAAETVGTGLTHGDSSLDHYREHYNTYYRNLRTLGDEWDYYFFPESPDYAPAAHW